MIGCTKFSLLNSNWALKKPFICNEPIRLYMTGSSSWELGTVSQQGTRFMTGSLQNACKQTRLHKIYLYNYLYKNINSTQKHQLVKKFAEAKAMQRTLLCFMSPNRVIITLMTGASPMLYIRTILMIFLVMLTFSTQQRVIFIH